MRSGTSSSGTSSSLAKTRLRTATPASITPSRVARDQGCHHGQIAPLRDEAIGAGRRQPGQRAHVMRRQRHAIGHDGGAVRVVLAAAGAGIEQAATDIRGEDRAGILVLQLDEAAAAAPVAERFPLLAVHRLERRGAPEGFVGLGSLTMGPYATAGGPREARAAHPRRAARVSKSVPKRDRRRGKESAVPAFHAGPLARARQQDMYVQSGRMMRRAGRNVA